MNRAQRRAAASRGGETGARPSPGADAYAAALAMMAERKTEQATALYLKCLERDPRHADARHDLGVLAIRRGDHHAAAQHLRQVVRLKPAHAGGWLNLGIALGELRLADEAVSAAERAVALNPESADAQGALGHALSLAGNGERAGAAFREALALDPDAALSSLRYAALLMGMDDAEGSLPLFDRYVALRPDDPNGFAGRASALNGLGRHADAERDLRRALELEPASITRLQALSQFLTRRGQLGEAIRVHDLAIAKSPGDHALYLGRSDLRQERGDREGALADLSAAVLLNPDDAKMFYNIARFQKRLGNADAATGFLLDAIRIEPDYIEAYAELSVLRQDKSDMTGALVLLKHAVELAPERLHLKLDLCWTRLNVCDWEGLEAAIADNLSRCIATAQTFPPFSLLALGIPGAELLLWTRAWAEQRVATLAKAPAATRPRAARDRTRPIRIGYLSADFRSHATATLVTELFERHDRTRFESFGYSIGITDRSALGQRIVASLDHFVDLTFLKDREAAARIAEDEIDILVDLKGYTTDSRPGIMFHRPAPIQVNYLGYPGSMGSKDIDYILADAIVAPAAHQAFYDEAVVHLPNCYQPNDRSRPGADPLASRARHGLPETGIVFCCFNNNYKITPLFFALWMRLLRDVPGSVLWLYQSNDEAVLNLRREAEQRGIQPERLVFAPRVSVADHIARLGLADLFLDTLPVNAHTTASEALWAGLPVLTCLGPHFVGRVAASLVHAVGLPELATETLADYEALALALARDPARLGALRERLAANRLSAPLFDTPRYVLNYEAALERMLAAHDAGQPPAPFGISEDL